MRIVVEKITSKDLFDKACSFTINKEVHPDLGKLYKAEHSPIRTQMFVVEMYDIPTFVSVHFIRHKLGVEHFVKTNREDRPGYSGDDLGRNQPVNHLMFLNAQALINMARKRLCGQSHMKTRNVMQKIAHELKKVDPELWKYLKAECNYRGICPEIHPCTEGPAKLEDYNESPDL